MFAGGPIATAKNEYANENGKQICFTDDNCS